LRVDVRDPSDVWYVTHWRKTTQVFFQILDNTRSEVIPESIRIVDNNSVRIEFFEPTAGTLHLIFDEDQFFDILPTPTVTPAFTPTVTPTISG
jgi:hypothetical protein